MADFNDDDYTYDNADLGEDTQIEPNPIESVEEALELFASVDEYCDYCETHGFAVDDDIAQALMDRDYEEQNSINKDYDDDEDTDDDDEDEEYDDDNISQKDIKDTVDSIEKKVKPDANTAKGVPKAGGTGGTAGAAGTSGASAGAAGAKAGAAGAKALVTNPWFWAIVAAIVLIIVIVILIIFIVAAAPYENVDIASGKFDTANGIRGDKFYGARVVYTDNEKAQNELVLHYENLSKDYILKISDDLELPLNIELDYEEENRPETITNMITAISQVTSNNAGTLSENLALINHFGYTNAELELIKSDLSNYVIAEKTEIFNGADTILDFDTQIVSIFENYYASLNISAPLYYVKDIILNNDEQMLENISKGNFVAFIPMQKTNVTINTLEYMFYIKYDEIYGEPQPKVHTELIEVVNNSPTVLQADDVDYLWWRDDTAEKTILAEDMNLNLTKFNSIDSENLTKLNDISIYSLGFATDSPIIDTSLIYAFFAHETTVEEDIVLSYLPSLDSNYVYLTFAPEIDFQFCEKEVGYD